MCPGLDPGNRNMMQGQAYDNTGHTYYKKSPIGKGSIIYESMVLITINDTGPLEVNFSINFSMPIPTE